VGIALVFWIQQSDSEDIIVQDSLLWGHDGKKSKPQWGKAFWEKIIGPFDLKSFKKTRLFWEFWLGVLAWRKMPGDRLSLGDGS
jgi:hypothetical protein